jgi:hypothetical protein
MPTDPLSEARQFALSLNILKRARDDGDGKWSRWGLENNRVDFADSVDKNENETNKFNVVPSIPVRRT